MKYLILIGFFVLNISAFSQEIGFIKDGEHIVQLHKINNEFSCLYSDVNDEISSELKSFQFPNIERVYNIILEGFENEKNHKTYVLTNKDTVVKFEFNRINGEVQLKIKHNNLNNNVIGSTPALSKDQIVQLFGNSVPY